MLAAAMLLATIFGCQAAQQTASSLMPLANARKSFEPTGSNDMVHHTYQELPVGMLLVWNLLLVAAKTCCNAAQPSDCQTSPRLFCQ